jgi:hypothetical protein
MQADFSVQILPFRQTLPLLSLATLKNAGLFLLAELSRAGRENSRNGIGGGSADLFSGLTMMIRAYWS